MHDAFKSALPRASWSDDPAEIEPHLIDWRGRGRGASSLLLRPASRDEVVRIVEIARDTRTPLVPQGGNTGLVLGGVPDASGRAVVVSMQRMNRIRSVSREDAAAEVEAGAILAEVQAAAAAADLLFPLSLGSEGSARIGGLIATNAGGVQVLHYGTMRALVLGLEAVMPDASLFSALTPLRKDNAGYDIKQLLIGSEGTLGIITAATLKLFPAIRSRATAFTGLDSADDAVELLARLRQVSGDCVSSFELVPRDGLDLVLRRISGCRDPLAGPHRWYVLVELSSPDSHAPLRDRLEQGLGDALQDGLIGDAAVAASEAQAAAFWKIRETLPEAEKLDGFSIKHDVSVSTARMPAFIREAGRELARRWPDARPLAFGHLGDGNVHFNLRAPEGSDSAQFAEQAHAEVSACVHDMVQRYGGSISAEHGIGSLRREELIRLGDPGKIAVMRAIKQALDPGGIMNPGRVI